LGVWQDITGHHVKGNEIEKNEMEMGDPSLFPLNRCEERGILCAIENEVLARDLKFAVGKLAYAEGNDWARNEKHGAAL